MSQVLLEQLRDVQTPPPISWWPLAPGWWILAVILIVTISAVVVTLRTRKRRNAYRVRAQIELEQCLRKWHDDQNNTAYLQTANAILKRCLRHISQQPSSVSTSGQPWVDTLEIYTAEPFSAGTRTAIADAVYRPKTKADIPEAHAELSLWLSNHQNPPKGKQQTATLQESPNA